MRSTQRRQFIQEDGKLTRLVSRLALIGTCAIGLSGLVAVPAEAANAPAVSPVTQITPESAVLNGVVDTGNVLPGTTYTFEYDTLADWNAGGDNAQFAPEVPGEVDASTSLAAVSVPIGCHPASVCNNTGEIPLTPGTQYVYFLDSQPGASGSYLNTVSLVSAEGMFTTPKLGSVKVSATALVAHGAAWISVTDASPMAAKGTVKLSLHGKTVGKAKFKLKPNATATVKVALPASLLVAGTKLKLTGTTSTDQPVKGGTVTLK
jgi:hypothetical protein